MKRTARGFAIYTEFHDQHGNEVRLQRSSAIGPRAAYLFTHFEDGTDHRPHPPSPGGIIVANPYLSPKQARRLAKALLKFADGAE